MKQDESKAGAKMGSEAVSSASGRESVSRFEMLYQVNTILQAKQQTLSGESRFKHQVQPSERRFYAEWFNPCHKLQKASGAGETHWKAEVISGSGSFQRPLIFCCSFEGTLNSSLSQLAVWGCLWQGCDFHLWLSRWGDIARSGQRGETQSETGEWQASVSCWQPLGTQGTKPCVIAEFWTASDVSLWVIAKDNNEIRTIILSYITIR